MSAVSKVVQVHERRSSLPQEIARTILAGFDKHYRLFRQASIDAKGLYERGAWNEIAHLARTRILMYDERVQEGVDAVRERFPEAERDDALWPAIGS